MAPLGGHLRRVAVADICHSELHIHVFNQQGVKVARESLQPIDTYEDVDEGYDAGFDRIEKVGRLQEEVAQWMTANVTDCR